jgi:CRISPR-associated protein Csb2
MGKIRTATKVFQPYLFDSSVPFLYAWQPREAAEGQQNALVICSLADRLYQLGRSIDTAWAWGESIEDVMLDARLAAYPGRVFRPSGHNCGLALMSPCPDSLDSLDRRYEAYSLRFSYAREGKGIKVVYRKPPPPRFRSVGYESPPSRQLYELRGPVSEDAFAPWPVERAHGLVMCVRDAAVERLKRAIPSSASNIDRVLVGRKPDGTNDCLPEDRVRIVPLPSIGHVHADRQIRRILVEVPATCSLRTDDVHWAFSGLELTNSDTGAVVNLVRTDDQSFLSHYGIGVEGAHRVWRTVTPAALPEEVRRLRIDPGRKLEQAKAGSERKQEQIRATAAVWQALRHAGVRSELESIRLQREPLEGNGRRAEEFAQEPRFSKHRLWHVEVKFRTPIAGPVTMGDGRFLGLGVMAPLIQANGIFTFAVESGLVGSADHEKLARALRRAVMSRVQKQLDEPLPTFFSAHEQDGSPARGNRSSHLAFAFDPPRARLLIIAPHVIDRRPPSEKERKYLVTLDRALEGLKEVRAGEAGVPSLRPILMDAENDPLFVSSRVWTSLTRYRVTRHFRAAEAREALILDIQAQLRTKGLPDATVTPFECQGIEGAGLEGAARVQFDVAITGPVLLGRNRHLGGGLFVAEPDQRNTWRDSDGK